MDHPALTDLPREIIREISLLVDARDTIALRQVHRSFFHLPVRLTEELPGLDLIDADIVISYPSIHSFTVAQHQIDWFFKLGSIYPGYNNIRHLEIHRMTEIDDPLPRALETLHIIPEYGKSFEEIRVDLGPLKKLRVLKYSNSNGNPTADGIFIYKLILNRPDTLIPWDQRIHLVELRCFPMESGDLSKFTNLRTLAIQTTVGMEYRLPAGITDLKVKISVIPNITNLHHLKRLYLHYAHIQRIDFFYPSSSITYLKLESVSFPPGFTHIDFAGFRELKYIFIDRLYKDGPDLPSWDVTESSSFTCTIANNHNLEKVSFKNIKITGAFPRNLIDVYMMSCELDSSIGSIDKIKHLNIKLTHLVDYILPPNLERLVLWDNIHREPENSYRLSELTSLESLVMTAVILDGPISPNVTKLFISRPKGCIDISHLSRLSTLSIDSGMGGMVERTTDFVDSFEASSGLTITGPIPVSLRDLDLEFCAQRFDLTNLVNLETLNIVGWKNNVTGFGTFPPSIKRLITDIDFNITEINLPNLREHRQI